MHAKTIYFLVVLFLLALASCSKDDEHPVPYVRVELDINVIHYNLNQPGMSAELLGHGYRGIFIYRVSENQFRAFDRACPDNPHQCTLNISEENQVIAEAECCDSDFILIDGSSVENVSPYPLREYRTSFNSSTNRLRVVN
jgi:hypothetical protein